MRKTATLGRSLGATARRGRSASPVPPRGAGRGRLENRTDRGASLTRRGSTSRQPSPALGRTGSANSTFGRGGKTIGGEAAGTLLESWNRQTPEDVKRIFQQADVDGNGSLDRSEFKELFRLLKTELTETQLEVLYEQVDANSNGEIEFSEFVDYVFAVSEREMSKSDFSEMEVEMPMGGGGLVLGGKMGNAVVKKGVMAKIKVGWRAVGLNGVRMNPDELTEALARMSRKSKYTLTFAVDDKTALHMVNKASAAHEKMPKLRAIARRELADLLGCTDLIELENQPEEQRREQLSNPRLGRLLVQAHAVPEAAILLRLSSGEEEQRHVSLFEALAANAVEEAMAILEGYPPPDLSKRDEDGNVPLHAVANVTCCATILAKAPESRTLLNLDGRNPLNEQLVRHPDSLDLGVVNLMLGDDPGVGREILLGCDRDGICAAMRMPNGHESLNGLPSWEQMLDALSLEPGDMIAALERLGGKDWPGLLSLHCFKDTLREGTHTEQSWERLGKVWECLSRQLQGCMDRNEHCLEAAKALLKATKGPNLPPVDMRLPYRRELKEMLDKISQKSGDQIAETYDLLGSEDAQWLKTDLGDYLNPDLVPDAMESVGLQKRLHMDFQLTSGHRAASALTPDWVNEETPPLNRVFADMQSVGMLGAVRKKDAAFDMLRLGGMGGTSEIGYFSTHEDCLLHMRYYGAYMRGLCQGQQEALNKRLLRAVADDAVPGENYFARKEAKGFPRIIEKTLERIEEIHQEVHDADLHLGEEVRTLLRRTPASICDVNGGTLVAQTPSELRSLYNKLTTSFRVLRTKNSYAQKAEGADYRDLKLFLAVDSEIGELIMEVQLILADDYKEKKWMHMPYVFERGDLDWEYTRKGLPTEYLFREGWRLYHGIQGSMGKREQQQAQDFLVGAADQGHFVARGLCHREGWGRWRRDDMLAMSCFSAAAQGQVGRLEALCRMGINYVGAVKDVAVYRRRGLEFLQQAAEGGEPEAVFQLALQEYSHREQHELLKTAARMGHRRAMNRLSYDAEGGHGKSLAALVDV